MVNTFFKKHFTVIPEEKLKVGLVLFSPVTRQGLIKNQEPARSQISRHAVEIGIDARARSFDIYSHLSAMLLA